MKHGQCPKDLNPTSIEHSLIHCFTFFKNEKTPELSSSPLYIYIYIYIYIHIYIYNYILYIYIHIYIYISNYILYIYIYIYIVLAKTLRTDSNK